ncbi:MAG: bifunctional metallophosphatase/5'-nucleotidase [Elusimicrobiales bacterium]|nr:bifunctional metallophosphatase/5'-nucleotidase [Elusimicrobiales bacterium]
MNNTKKILVSLSFAFSMPFAAATAQALDISIYHTSDVHGSYAAHKAGASFGKKNASKMIGGFPALISYIKKDAGKSPYILLDSGDMFQGTPEGVASKCLASADFMNLAGYSAVAAGNHDFDYGGPAFKVLAGKMKAAMLSANLQLQKTGKDGKIQITQPKYVKPYIIVKKAGKRIAIIGLSHKNSTETGGRNLGKDITGFEDEAFTSGKIIKEVREKENPDAVILLNHSGTFGDVFQGKTIDPSKEKLNEEDKYVGVEMARLAKEMGYGIDLVLSGHEHTALIGGYYDKESGTWFAESGTKLNYVSKAVMHFNDDSGKLEKIDVELVPLWAENGEDAKALKLVKKYEKIVKSQMSKVIGYTEGGLAAGNSPLNNPLAQWTCAITQIEAGGEISMQNSSSFSIGLPDGKVTLQDLYKSMKFDNTLYKVSLPGKGIEEIIKANFTENDRTQVYFSGMTVEYKAGKNGPENVRIFVEGVPLDQKRIYTVITNDYFVNVNKLGAAFKQYAVKIENTGFGVRETMQKNLESTLASKPEKDKSAAISDAFAPLSAEYYPCGYKAK